MKKILLLMIGILWLHNAPAQMLSNVDMDLVKKETSNEASNYHYPKLLNRFTSGDTTLTDFEYLCIYYGQVYQTFYNPYGATKSEDEFYETYNKQEYKKSLKAGLRAMEENPLNLRVAFKLLVCYSQLKDTVQANKWAFRYFPMLNVIYGSGNGETCEHGFVVCSVNDEYELLSDMQMKSGGQALVGDCDRLSVDDDRVKNKALFFNISLPFSYLSDSFKISGKEQGSKQKKKKAKNKL